MTIGEFILEIAFGEADTKPLDESKRKAEQAARAMSQAWDVALDKIFATTSAGAQKVGDAAEQAAARASKAAKQIEDDFLAAVEGASAAIDQAQLAVTSKTGDGGIAPLGALDLDEAEKFADSINVSKDAVLSLGDGAKQALPPLQDLSDAQTRAGGAADGLVNKLASFATAGFLVGKAAQVVSQALADYDKRVEDAAKATLMSTAELEKAGTAADAYAIALHKTSEEQRDWTDAVIDFAMPFRDLERQMRAQAATQAEVSQQMRAVFNGAQAAADGIKLLNDTAAQFTGFAGLDSANEALRELTRLLGFANAAAQKNIDDALGKIAKINALTASTVSAGDRAENEARAAGITDPALLALARRQAGGGGKGKSAKERAAEAAVAAGTARARELFESDFQAVNRLRELGLSASVLDESIKAAGKAFAEGDTEGVARAAGLGVLSKRSGVPLKTTIGKDPLLSELGLQENLPDIEMSALARGAQPQVLISTINNTFTFENDIDVNGAGDPVGVASEVAEQIRDLFESQVEQTTKTVKVVYAR